MSNLCDKCERNESCSEVVKITLLECRDFIDIGKLPIPLSGGTGEQEEIGINHAYATGYQDGLEEGIKKGREGFVRDLTRSILATLGTPEYWWTPETGWIKRENL